MCSSDIKGTLKRHIRLNGSVIPAMTSKWLCCSSAEHKFVRLIPRCDGRIPTGVKCKNTHICFRSLENAMWSKLIWIPAQQRPL